MQHPVLRPADILLPAPGTDLSRWAVLACDQFTSQPEYWQQVQQLVGRSPSTLHLIYPEVYLGREDPAPRIAAIHAAMGQYRGEVLQSVLHGYVYVERTLQSGAVRQGLVGCVDLEDYSYTPGANARIRPSENTVVERIPPRLAVRRGAPLESPHILMLADDPEKTIIEPIAARKEQLQPLYDISLMLQGGRIRAWALTEPEELAAVGRALALLDDQQRFDQLYGCAGRPAFALAVGDGNHSLATAKAYWEEIKHTVADKQAHPARYCLVELENVRSSAIEIEPIHRVVFGATPDSMLRAMALYAKAQGAEVVPGGKGHQQFTAIHGEQEVALAVENPPVPLAAGTLEGFLAEYLAHHPDAQVDYVHGEADVRHLAARGAIGILLPPFEKGDLFRGVALGGVLPKKTFSMGHAREKRYYLECRAID